MSESPGYTLYYFSPHNLSTVYSYSPGALLKPLSGLPAYYSKLAAIEEMVKLGAIRSRIKEVNYSAEGSSVVV